MPWQPTYSFKNWAMAELVAPLLMTTVDGQMCFVDPCLFSVCLDFKTFKAEMRL